MVTTTGHTDSITLGELTRRFAVTEEVVNDYDRLGLLASRVIEGQRRYCSIAQSRLRVVLRARAFGFSLDEIGKILDRAPTTPGFFPCDSLAHILDEIEAVDDRSTVRDAIADLKKHLGLPG